MTATKVADEEAVSISAAFEVLTRLQAGVAGKIDFEPLFLAHAEAHAQDLLQVATKDETQGGPFPMATSSRCAKLTNTSHLQFGTYAMLPAPFPIGGSGSRPTIHSGRKIGEGRGRLTTAFATVHERKDNQQSLGAESRISIPWSKREIRATGKFRMPHRNIVLLSDGTGNSSIAPQKSNVWRLFEALDLGPEYHQIAFYDDGVGTSGFKLLRLIGGAFGWGLSRNVRDLYRKLCRHYKPGDRIYIFGFSRGAFTARVLAHFIGVCGVLDRSKPAPGGARTMETERGLRRGVRKAYKSYRRSYWGPGVRAAQNDRAAATLGAQSVAWNGGTTAGRVQAALQLPERRGPTDDQFRRRMGHG